MASGQVKGEAPQNTWGQTGVATAPQLGTQPMPTLTEEERQIMRECDRDSFFQRAVPLSLGAMLGAHMLVRSGRWSPNPKYGSLPKVLAMGGIGYFVGKVSYLPLCQKKILEKLPNSNLAAAIRKSKGLPEHDASTAQWDDRANSSSVSSRAKEDYSAPEGLDDRFRPSVDRDVKEPETTPQEKGSTTYEELRRRNRQEYEDQLSKMPPKTPGAAPFRDSPPIAQKPLPEVPGDTDSISELPAPPPAQAPPKKKRTNIWGDTIED